ncbi:hypothetical protein ALPO108162_09230 [Alicyclobacillus pomorum]|jgi:hypothetical protein
MTLHGEFLNGALDPIGAILLCVLCSIAVLVWSVKQSE